jgi:carbon monoxide dehydrogenase subunit G
MASIIKEFIVEASSERVWSALRDFNAVHQRLAPGFLTECRIDGSTRILTFFNGMVAREQLVGIDDQARRLCYTVVGGGSAHHNASAQVFDAGTNRTRFVWITDVLPDEAAVPIGAMMEQGIAAMKKALEAK